MKRRDFLRGVVPVSALPFLMNGLPVRAFGRSRFLETLTGALLATDRVLVLVQLSGGNDGINTVIPLGQIDLYTNARSNIAISATDITNAGTTLTAGSALHPKMVGMKALYDDGKLMVVQGVSYPNPNLSHFRATDIWMTAANADEYLLDGWVGRYLNQEFTGYPAGYPNQVMPDPLAIQIGSVTSAALEGPGRSMGISITDANTYYQLVNPTGNLGGGTDAPPQTPAGHELAYIRQVAVDCLQYASVIKTAAGKVKQQQAYRNLTTNTLAAQLKIVAQLIGGGLKTRIYVVSMGGFDNHSSQVLTSDHTSGTHATLLQRLSEAVQDFQNDIKFLGIEDRVIGMTFSEFGRRVQSNASLGTDHGTSAPVFVFGKGINGGVSNGVLGAYPSLNVPSNTNLGMTYDFRSVYASILSQWFGVSASELSAVMLRNFTQLPVIKPGVAVDVEHEPGVPREYVLYENYPNPFNPSTTISYDLPNEADVVLKVYDMLGREVTTLLDTRQGAGHHVVPFSATANMASGAFIYQIQAGSFRDRKKMMYLK